MLILNVYLKIVSMNTGSLLAEQRMYRQTLNTVEV